MLKLLRKQKFAKKIFYLLAIIIVPSFILWGSATVIRDRNEKGPKGYAGKIFGKKVSFEKYLGALHAWRNELRMRFGNQAMQAETLLDSNESVWDKLILLAEAKRLKIKVDNNELTSYITSLPFLQRDGRFNPELYNLFLKYSLGTPPRIFEEQIRDSLKIQKIFDFVTDDILASETEVKNRYKQENEQIKLRYIAVLSEDLKNMVKVKEDELKDYYEKNKDTFKIPIQINLSYIGIEYPEGATDEQKEEIQKKIAEAHEAVSESNDLATTKEDLDLQTKSTGFFALGEIMPEVKMPPQDNIVLFNLKEDRISNIMQTSRGAYIFQLKEKRIDHIPEFEEVKERVTSRITEEKAKELAKSIIDTYYSEVKSEKELNPDSNIKDIANKLNLPTKETEFFTRNSYPQDLGESEDLSNVVFELEKGEISQPVELPQGYFIVERTEFKPIDEEDFQNDKEIFEKVVLEEKKNKSFEDYFTKLKDQSQLVDYVSMQQNKVVPTNSN